MTDIKPLETPSSSSKKESASTADDSQLDLDTTTNKELPYGAEYAKSGRAACKGCKELISKDSLRMAVRFPSKFFDGMQSNWHHYECFWKKARKNDINEVSIRGMETLKWEDQERIRQRIEELKASDGDGYTPRAAAIKVEHAKTEKGKCFACKEKIGKGELRIASKSSFYHTKCFQEMNSTKSLFMKSAENMIGYDQLDDEEKAQLEALFPKPQELTETGKKRKHEEEGTSTNADLSTNPAVKKEKLEDDASTKKALKKQSETFWTIRQQFRDTLHPDVMQALLVANGNYKSKKGGVDGMLDKLVDMVVFGPPQPCPECQGPLNYSTDKHAYRCSGNISEYARCTYTTRNPGRTQFKIPKDLRQGNDCLKKLKSPMLSERVYSVAATKEEIVLESKAFKHLNFAAHIEKSRAKSGASGSQKMVVKHGYVVDSKCTVASTTHVYVDPVTKKPWQANLSAMDISTGKNSFYKLQIVKDDNVSKFYLFRAWGRVGTEIGGTKTEKMSLEDCTELFERLFQEKTQNTWEDYVHGNFKKNAHGMDAIEVGYTEKKKPDKKLATKLNVSMSKSKLAREVKELISMIFDVDAMNAAMKEFEIDLEKMPLGHFTHNHILKAYNVLTDLQRVLEERQGSSNENAKTVPKGKFIEFTNRFYTLIPHATGLGTPPMLDNMQILKEKTAMLDNLLEIEIAYKIIESDSDEVNSGAKDVFDSHYERLNCAIEPLDQGTDEFSLIKRYVENTHAPTHEIRLEIVNVLKVEREVEAKRFKEQIGNRHLLWHGSRTTNYAGILSQGLRIAPPEAPVTGYMFGKGIYTADMVTKSANYCYTMAGEGLLLLCDVDLGEVQLEKDAKDIKKPKRGKNSVKGIGGVQPNPAESERLGDCCVPCGKPIKSKEEDLSLLYNEYIVYDEAQIKLRYIVRVKFHNKLL